MSNSPNDPDRHAEETARTDDRRGETGDDAGVRNSAPEAGKTDRGARSPDPETDRADPTDRPADSGLEAGRDAGGAGGRTGTDLRKLLTALVALAGLWIAASPYLYGSTTIGRWNNLAVGGGILLLAAYNAYRMHERRGGHTGIAGVVALLGLWSVIAPFMLEFEGRGLFWSTIVTGLVVLGLSAYDVYQSRRTGAAARTGTRA